MKDLSVDSVDRVSRGGHSEDVFAALELRGKEPLEVLIVETTPHNSGRLERATKREVSR